MARRQAETWVGDAWMQTLPAINGASWSLHKRPESANYHFSTYMDYNGWWWAISGVTAASWTPGTLAALGMSATTTKIIQWLAVAVDAAGITSDLTGWNVLPGPLIALSQQSTMIQSGLGDLPGNCIACPEDDHEC